MCKVGLGLSLGCSLFVDFHAAILDIAAVLILTVVHSLKQNVCS